MKRFKIGPGQRKLGLVAVDPSVHQLDSPTNSRGSSSRSRPATETVTPLNMWN
jgi:hypothetical protein